jgi:Mg2+-importing ATPase
VSPPAAPASYWSHSAEDVLRQLDASASGLHPSEVARRRARFGPNLVRPPERHGALRLAARQLASPIALLLLASAVLSAFLGERVDAFIILAILLGSAALGFWQERRAQGVVEALLGRIHTTTCVRRAGVDAEVALEDVVPGDIVVLNAGDLVPADCRIVSARDLDVDEAVLTGESFPVSKDAEAVPAERPLGDRGSALFQGTHVVSGTATAVVAHTGERTVYGALAHEIERRRPESEFERGVRRFGYLLLEITALLMLVVFAVNVALDRPALEVFMFALALAVGLTPQLLPAIVSVTLAQGARRMAARQVVVRRLVSIEDFGGMTVLCTDKTGTLTEGRVHVRSALSADGAPSERAHRLAWLNATLQAGYENPIDAALRAGRSFDRAGVRKLDEIPYDFSRRRLSVLVEEADGARLLVTKGAVPEVLAACVTAEGGTATAGDWRAGVARLVAEQGARGLRCIGVAVRGLDGATAAHRSDERDMTFVGVITLADPPKQGAREALARLEALGVQVKMLTGDASVVAAAVARETGLSAEHMLTGAEIGRLSDGALRRRVRSADVFAEVDPNQKERLIVALRGGGASVGYLGDGINDAAALHAADVGISVDTAVDVTRRAADVVLLRKDLQVLAEGVAEGRRAFANTLKYVFVTTSASFGNMFSMAVASFFSAFLPMLPKQILLLNLLSDLPAMAIATDRLDPELVARPRRWDVRFIRDFMITFGLVSSAFDLLTFALLVRLEVPVAQFRAAWFVESLLTEVLVLLVIRTSRVFYRSPPSAVLVAVTAGVTVLAVALPYLPGHGLLGLAPLPLPLLGTVGALTALLLLASEIAKRSFFRHHPAGGKPRRSRRSPA